MLIEQPAIPKYIVGFDLADDFCQVAFLENPGKKTPKDPVTYSLIEGGEQYDIPTAIAKQNGVNRWVCGQEAVAAASDGTSTYIPHLVTLAIEGSPVPVENSRYEPTALLALYISRVLMRISNRVPTQEIGAIMFTSRLMDNRMISILENVKKRLNLTSELYFESHESSYYNYLLMQAQSVREPGSMLVEYETGGEIRICRMMYNTRTKPIIAWQEKESAPGLFSETMEERDGELLGILQKAIDRRQISSVYLVGSGFDLEHMKKTVTFPLRGRRVFSGSNLYGKGACYGAYLRLNQPEIASQYYFLDDNRLKENIGIRAQVKGETVYHPFLEAGVNWYEADVTDDLILEDGNELHLVLTPLTGGKVEDFMIRLDHLPVREGRTTRIRLHFTMTARDMVHLVIEDLGFGEIFPSTGLKWEQNITIHG